MNRRILLFLVLAGALLYWLYLLDAYRKERSIVGLPAPQLSLVDEEGAIVKLADYRGRVVLLHFWATWCPPCLHEIPSLDRLNRKMRDHPFALLAVSMDEEGVRPVEVFRSKVPFDLKILFDPEMEASEAFQTYKLPESFLINKDGVIVKRIVGPQDWEDPSWEGMIKELL